MAFAPQRGLSSWVSRQLPLAGVMDALPRDNPFSLGARKRRQAGILVERILSVGDPSTRLFITPPKCLCLLAQVSKDKAPSTQGYFVKYPRILRQVPKDTSSSTQGYFAKCPSMPRERPAMPWPWTSRGGGNGAPSRWDDNGLVEKGWGNLVGSMTVSISGFHLS